MSRERNTQPLLGDPRVLVVDDEADALGEYAELLEIYGINCAVEADPVSATARVLECHSIEVVVTDLQMPAVNGAELIGRIRERLPGHRKIHFVVVSGFVDPDLMATIPGVPSIHKPVIPEQLLGTIREGLRRD